MEPGTIVQVWAWLWQEIATYGVRWFVEGIVVAVLGGWWYWGGRNVGRRLAALESEKKLPSQTINMNIGDVAKKISQEDPGHPAPKGRVAEYIPDDKILRIGTKTGPMEIRLWDERKTVEDVLRVLSKHAELKSLDDL